MLCQRVTGWIARARKHTIAMTMKVVKRERKRRSVEEEEEEDGSKRGYVCMETLAPGVEYVVSYLIRT